MYERFTDRARKVMHFANQEAKRLNHEYIGTEHILLGLVQEGSGVAANVLKNLDVDLHKVRLEVERIVQPGPDMAMEGKVPHTPCAKKVLEFAIEEAHALEHNYLGTEHLMLGLFREQEGVAAQVLMGLGLRLEVVREEVLNLMSTPAPGSGGGRTHQDTRSLTEGAKSKTPVLDSFGIDLTEQARAGTTSPLVGRTAELEKILTALTSMRSPHLLLIGERGVGKSALIRGLAGKIACEEFPPGLPGRVVSLDLASPSFNQGTTQDSERILACLHEARREYVILSLEGATTLFALRRRGPAALVMAWLRQAETPVVVSLTVAEFHRYIAPFGDRAERFQALHIHALSREETLEVLRQEREQYAEFHSVNVPEALLGRVAFLADRSLPGSLPGKALQLLDRAAALTWLRHGATTETPRRKQRLMKRLEELAEAKEAAVANQKFVEAARLRDEENLLLKEMAQPESSNNPVMQHPTLNELILNDALTMLKESANHINPDLVIGEDEIPF